MILIHKLATKKPETSGASQEMRIFALQHTQSDKLHASPDYKEPTVEGTGAAQQTSLSHTMKTHSGSPITTHVLSKLLYNI